MSCSPEKKRLLGAGQQGDSQPVFEAPTAEVFACDSLADGPMLETGLSGEG